MLTTLVLACLFLVPSSVEAQKIPFPIFENAHNAIGRNQYLNGEFSQARSFYENRYANDPSDDEAAFILGTIAFADYDWAKAVKYLGVAKDLKPNTMQYILYYAWASELYMQEAPVFKAIGMAKAFRGFAEDVTVRFPDNAELQQILVRYNIKTPGIAGGNINEAKERIPHLKSLSPSLGLKYEALLADAEGDENNADRLFAEAARYGNARTYMDWTIWLVTKKKGARAMSIASINKDKTDNPLLMRYLFGSLNAETGLQRTEGLAALDEYIAAPWESDLATKGEAYCQKAKIYMSQGDKDKALVELRRSLALQPNLISSLTMMKALSK